MTDKPTKTAMEQDRDWRAEWRAMTEEERDRAVEKMIAMFEKLFQKIENEVTR
ncbi:MAG: hypothetical protein ACYTBJ_18720 [Planctomycetota bacterium]|jgi:hypothetical protein